jgi:hypothetical protein
MTCTTMWRMAFEVIPVPGQRFAAVASRSVFGISKFYGPQRFIVATEGRRLDRRQVDEIVGTEQRFLAQRRGDCRVEPYLFAGFPPSRATFGQPSTQAMVEICR